MVLYKLCAKHAHNAQNTPVEANTGPNAEQFVVAGHPYAVGIMPGKCHASLGICPVKMVPPLLGMPPSIPPNMPCTPNNMLCCIAPKNGSSSNQYFKVNGLQS